MDDIKFNMNAFIKPETKQEYIELLNEAIRLAEEINLQINELLNSKL